MKTFTLRFVGEHRMRKAVEDLIKSSQFFSIMPLPDDEWGVSVRAENEAMLRHIGRYSACRKCEGEMHPGVAMQNTLTGIGDFHDKDRAVTVSPGGPGKLIPCMKCEKCGYSVTVTQQALQDIVDDAQQLGLGY